MLFSIVTVCLNAETLIEQTIKSVISQNFGDFEYIIIDGASEDKTLDIIYRYQKHLKHFTSEADESIYNAMNKAIRFCDGEYVVFMNAGDVFTNNDVLQNIATFCKKGIDFVYGNRYRVDSKGIRKFEKAGDPIDSFYKETIFHQALFTRSALLKERSYNESYKLAADYEYILYALKKNYSFVYSNVAVADWLEGGCSRKNYLLAQIEAIKASLHYLDNREKIRSNFFFENLVLQNVGYILNKHIQNCHQSCSGLKLVPEIKGRSLVIKARKGTPELQKVLNRINEPLMALNNNRLKKQKPSWLKKIFKRSSPHYVNDKNDVKQPLNKHQSRKSLQKFDPAENKLSSIKFSIITVCYNAENLLPQTIRSVINQTHKNVEYIVIDGNSTDNTGKILMEHKNHISKLISEQDEGMYDAMNKAINLVTGDYVLYLNAGDTFFSDKVLEQINNKISSRFDLIYGARIYKNADGEETYQKANDLETVFYRMPYCHQSLFLKTSVLKSFPFNTTYRYAADYEQSVKMYLGQCSYLKVEEPICVFLSGGASESGIRPYLETLKILFDYCKDKKTIKKSLYLNAFQRNSHHLLNL